MIFIIEMSNLVILNSRNASELHMRLLKITTASLLLQTYWISFKGEF